jgi:tetratricopeptide (TPR) repeat protein
MAAPVEEARIPQLIRDWESQVERLRQEDAAALAMARPAARLAMLCVEVGRYEDALRWARAPLVATDRLPGSPMKVNTLSFIGSLYLDLRQLERAERCLREVLELDPGLAGAWFNLSHALHWIAARLLNDDAAARVEALLWPRETIH